ncbi:MAG TPA: ABC transporter ATP-binding protein [Armatimonadota bacterium]|nr:ABC transporter ATP-binding protein [Armatimonadota bacterium]
MRIRIPEGFTGRGIQRLWPYVLANKTRLSFGILCALLATCFTFATVKMLGSIIDAGNAVPIDAALVQQFLSAAQHPPISPVVIHKLALYIQKHQPHPASIDRLAGWLVLLFLLKGLASYGETYLVNAASQRVLLRLRNEVYEHLQRMGLRFFDRRKTGQLMASVTADIPQIQNAVGSYIVDAINSPFTICGGIAYVLWLNWRLAVLSGMIIPVISFFISLARRRMGRATHLMQTALADVSELLEESLTCVRVIRAFVMEDAETLRFVHRSETSYRAYMRGVRIQAALRPLVEFIGALGIVLAIWVGEMQIAANPHAFTLGSLLQFVGVVHYVAEAFGGIGNLSLGFQRANVAAERVFDLLDEKPDVQDAPGAPELGPVRGVVEFRDVHFSYDDDPVLRGISFRAEPGEALAIVGPSGAGKSTIANLLPRFYEVDAGAVLIDGHDVRDVTACSLRRQIGIVAQESVLFSVSLRENIAYGRPDATEEEIRAAAMAANALDFIDDLPEGMDTVVGQRGATLSGGQRQRIAIARAILGNPRILVLDEATSSLDAHSESIVQAALERLMPGRTTLVIAHRLSTVRNADRILVLSEGRIAEEGRHAELVARGGLYADLYHRQMQSHAEVVVNTRAGALDPVDGAAISTAGADA